ncbi:MAG: DUF4326 domain-containing protein [Micromonospora sp.]
MTDVAILTAAEVDCLADCEQRIERGLKTFVEVGTSLATIRDNRLYRAEFGTFEDYCQDRWGFDRTRAQNFITAARTVLEISNTGLPAPERESQARELARVPEPERADIWRETVERTDGKPTAAAIRETYERTQTPAITPEPEPDGTDVAPGSGHDHPRPSAGEAGPTAAFPPPLAQHERPEDRWSDDERDLAKRLRAGETVVVSMRSHGNLIAWAEAEGLYERVDRRTQWGNPFEMPADGDRATVIANYQWYYLPYKPSLTAKVHSLKGKALGCWCAPEECHGDVLAELAEGGELR